MFPSYKNQPTDLQVKSTDRYVMRALIVDTLRKAILKKEIGGFL